MNFTLVPYSYSEKIGCLCEIRDSSLEEPHREIEGIARAWTEHHQDSFVRRFWRWCRELGLTDRRCRLIHWERLDGYLKPEFRLRKEPGPVCRTHGSELLYAL